MATTTTYHAIRDNSIALLEAATPYKLVQHLFRRAPRHRDIRDWAPESGTAALRAFELRRGDDLPDAAHLGTGAQEREETMLLSIAYPVLVALYGEGELDELECVMRSDATLVRDVLFSGNNYLAGQSLALVTPETPDRSDERCWFQDYRVQLIFTELITPS
jgi:hypothetical protein